MMKGRVWSAPSSVWKKATLTAPMRMLREVPSMSAGPGQAEVREN
jgi:hypothetical protein